MSVEKKQKKLISWAGCLCFPIHAKSRFSHDAAHYHYFLSNCMKTDQSIFIFMLFPKYSISISINMILED